MTEDDDQMSWRPIALRQERARHSFRRMRLFGVATLLAVMLLSLSAQDTSAQFRYRVQAGESLQSIASKFGVEAEAIRRSSFMPDPNNLVAGQVIVIPYAWQTPEEAALMASEREGTSPFTAGVHWVEAGDSIWYIADLYGVDRFELATFNGLSADAALAVGDRILLPGDASVSASTNLATAGETTNSLSDAISAGYVAELSAQGFAWVPQYRQQRNLSCEYAAAYIATSSFGSPIHESVFLDWVPQTQNPHYGYRGNIDGIWGGYDDYGVYASALVPALNAHGYAGEVFYGGYSASQLTAHLDAGHPVLVWLSMWGDPGIVYEDEGRYTVFAGMHVVTAFAYDSAGVYVSDPGAGAYRHFDWDTFMNMWGLVDGMALAVYPY